MLQQDLHAGHASVPSQKTTNLNQVPKLYSNARADSRQTADVGPGFRAFGSSPKAQATARAAGKAGRQALPEDICAGLVVIARGKHPIPSRTRP